MEQCFQGQIIHFKVDRCNESKSWVRFFQMCDFRSQGKDCVPSVHHWEFTFVEALGLARCVRFDLEADKCRCRQKDQTAL